MVDESSWTDNNKYLVVVLPCPVLPKYIRYQNLLLSVKVSRGQHQTRLIEGREVKSIRVGVGLLLENIHHFQLTESIKTYIPLSLFLIKLQTENVDCLPSLTICLFELHPFQIYRIF